MAISWISLNASQTAHASAPVVVYPGDLVAGANLILCVVTKYPSAVVATPSGFEFVADVSGGAGSNGAGSGQVKVSIFRKISNGTETGDVTLSVSGGNINLARMFAIGSDAGKALNLAFASGAFNTANSTGWTVTTTDDLDVSANDFIIEISGINNQTHTFTNYTFTQSGVSFGSRSQRTSSATSGGDDLRIQIATCTVSSGSADSPITYSMTANASDANGPAGCTMILRFREITGKRRIHII